MKIPPTSRWIARSRTAPRPRDVVACGRRLPPCRRRRSPVAIRGGWSVRPPRGCLRADLPHRRAASPATAGAGTSRLSEKWSTNDANVHAVEEYRGALLPEHSVYVDGGDDDDCGMVGKICVVNFLLN